MVGKVYDNLTVIGLVKVPKTDSRNGNTYHRTDLRCQCVCGRTMVHSVSNVERGSVKSCGCKKLEVLARTSFPKTHGLSTHPHYHRWMQMIKRCTRKENNNYKHYGGRGITVCDRWLTFSNWLEDMDASFRPGLTIERIDNEKGYSPDNCVWATRAAQQVNKRKGTRKKSLAPIQ